MQLILVFAFYFCIRDPNLRFNSLAKFCIYCSNSWKGRLSVNRKLHSYTATFYLTFSNHICCAFYSHCYKIDVNYVCNTFLREKNLTFYIKTFYMKAIWNKLVHFRSNIKVMVQKKKDLGTVASLSLRIKR